MAVVWLFDCLFGLAVRLLGGVLDVQGDASLLFSFSVSPVASQFAVMLSVAASVLLVSVGIS